MISEFHFLRPLWLFAFIPLGILARLLFKQALDSSVWQAICDPHLLPHLIHRRGQRYRNLACLLLVISAGLIIFSLAGPTWSRWPAPAFKQIQPRVIVLDLSTAMLDHELSPNRLERAKFKLHDLFVRKNIGQIGLVVYSGEPFVVSPLTDDAQTIDALLASLTTDIMPVDGYNLTMALKEGQKLIKQAGFHQGDILVVSSQQPSPDAIVEAASLADDNIYSSILFVSAKTVLSQTINDFAKAGQGIALSLSSRSDDIDQWLALHKMTKQLTSNRHNQVEIWQDQGRWFALLALIILWPVFWRGWLDRI
ncbi:MAG: vWA domain-containing protein [Legionella sp.]